jgi:hypothetical protein
MINGRLAFVPLGLLWLSGCGTIFTGTSDEIKFSANVPGVRLTIDGQYKGELPLSVVQSRSFMGNGETFKAKFEAPGYETQEFILKRQFNTVAVLDITSITTSGGIDLLTGSLWQFEPKEYHIQMLKKGKGAAEFEREKRLWHYALMNYWKLRADLAEGGGEYLESFASALAGTRGGIDSVIVEQTLRSAPVLIEASGPQDFVYRLNRVLASDPRLRLFRI